MKTTYGERLRLAREHKGLTQEQLVEISGVKQGTISKIERGDQNSSGFDAELAYTLGVEAMWLKTGKDEFAPKWINGTADVTEVTSEALEFAKLWQNLPPEQKAVLSMTAKAFIHSAEKQTDKVA
jgi:transcriptional regulator with XRE-family HTH domain